MTKEEIDTLLVYYTKCLGAHRKGQRSNVTQLHPEEREGGELHLLHMIETMQADILPSFHEPKMRDKAMRWLGFIQGALWVYRAFTILEMAEHNKHGVT